MATTFASVVSSVVLLLLATQSYAQSGSFVGVSCAVNSTILTFNQNTFQTKLAAAFGVPVARVRVINYDRSQVDGLIVVELVIYEDAASTSTATALANIMVNNPASLTALNAVYNLYLAQINPGLTLPPPTPPPVVPNIQPVKSEFTQVKWIVLFIASALGMIGCIAFIYNYLVYWRHDRSLYYVPEEDGGEGTLAFRVGEMFTDDLNCEGNSHLPELIGTYPGLTSVVSGTYHTIIVTSRGVFVAGDNSSGQLGLGHRNRVPSFVKNPFFDERQVYRVWAGEEFSAFLCEDGFYTCGAGRDGVLGHGDLSDRLQPTRVDFFDDKHVKGGAAGTHHLVILCEEGLYSFGWGKHGQLMNGGTESECTPILVESFAGYESTIRDIACGVTHTLILCNDAELYACGGNEFGQLGLGHKDDVFEPTFVPLSETSRYIRSMSAWYHTIIACDDGVYAWGEGSSHKLGGGDKKPKNIRQPRWVSGLQGIDISFVVASTEHSLAISSDEVPRVYVWGKTTYGKLGFSEMEVGEIIATPTESFANEGYILKGISVTATQTLLMYEPVQEPSFEGGSSGEQPFTSLQKTQLLGQTQKLEATTKLGATTKKSDPFSQSMKQLSSTQSQMNSTRKVKDYLNSTHQPIILDPDFGVTQRSSRNGKGGEADLPKKFS